MGKAEDFELMILRNKIIYISVLVLDDPVVVTSDLCANLNDSHYPTYLKIWLTSGTHLAFKF